MPMNPTTRPTSRAGYMAPHRRRWNGPPNERLIQKTNATAIITGAIGTTNTSRSEAAPMPRMSASLRRGARPEPAGEGAQEVGDERRRRQRGQAEGLETAAPRDRRQEGGDERHRDADADRRDEVEREIAPERAPARRRVE